MKKTAKKAAKASRKTSATSSSSASRAAPRQLTPKQRFFISEYLANGFNATKAAIAAGYAKKSADTQGSRLLANPLIAAALAKSAEKTLAKHEITAERVLQAIADLAFFDPRKLFDAGGELVPVHLLGDHEAGSIAGLDVAEIRQGGFVVGRLKKIKIADKGQNLERLGRYLKLFVDRVEHTGEVKIQRVLLPAKAAPPAKHEPKPDFA